MSEFMYKAIDSNGKNIKGTISAPSEAEALSELEQTGRIPISIREKIVDGNSLRNHRGGRGRQDRRGLEFFSRQFGTLLKAGIPVIEALITLSHDNELKGFSHVLPEMIKDVQGGSTIADALKKHKRTFPDVYVQTVRAGETGGVLPETLEQLSDILESQQETVQAIKSATRYPMIVVAALVGAFFILVGFVLPKLATLFSRFDTELPLPTLIMMKLHLFLKHYWYLIPIVIAALSAGLYFALRVPRIRLFWEKHKTDLPIFGSLFTKVYMERFCQMMKVLIQAGIPILTVLDNVCSTTGNLFINKEIERMKISVNAGNPMGAFMRNSAAFPHLVSQMVGLGEKSGQLPELLEMCSRHYRREIKYKLKDLTSSIEPVLTIAIGAVIFFFMLAVFMPIWNTVQFLK